MVCCDRHFLFCCSALNVTWKGRWLRNINWPKYCLAPLAIFCPLFHLLNHTIFSPYFPSFPNMNILFLLPIFNLHHLFLPICVSRPGFSLSFFSHCYCDKATLAGKSLSIYCSSNSSYIIKTTALWVGTRFIDCPWQACKCSNSLWPHSAAIISHIL